MASGFHKPHVLIEDYDEYNKKMEQIFEDFEAKQKEGSVVSQVPEQEDEAKGVSV